MHKRTTTLGVALAGAVVLAGGAYALGAQKDDGNASANGPRMAGYGPGGYGFRGGPGGPGGPGGGGPMGQRLDDFAQKLGVTPDKLRQALEDLRPDRGQPGDKRDEMASELADALGLPEAKVSAALAKVRPKGMGRRPGGPGRPPQGAPPQGGPGGPPQGGPPPGRRGFRDAGINALAKELGIEPAKLRTALQGLRQSKRDEFAQKLADKLGIPVAKVKDALPDRPGP